MIHLLAEATELFASSLDYQRTLTRITELAVPRIADWCTVDIVNEGKIERLAVAHIDPKKVKWANELAKKFPFDSDAPTGVPHVIRTGKSEFVPEITQEIIDAAHLNKEQLDILDELGLKSAMTVPLVARSFVLGAISFVMAESGRHFTQEDLTLAEDLGRLGGLAVDNAMLYRAAQQEIASRTQTEQELRKAKDAAEASEQELAIANKAKDRFLAILSHELRTPLTPVLAAIEALQDENGNEDIRSWLDIIQRNAELEVRLIDDLLDLTRIANGKLRLKKETADINRLLQNSAAMFQVEIVAKHLVLDTKWDAKEAMVEGDPARLQQIFWNIIKNAIKFTPEGGTIVLRTFDRDGTVAIEVKDTGIGIAPEELKNIFDPFEQGENAGGQFGGLGLGLAISSLLVEAHGGTISAQSGGKGHGSTFTLEFQRAHTMRIHPEVDGQSRNRSSERRRDILLIDDHQDTSTTVSLVLKRKGYYVRTARNAQEALMAMMEQSPDLIVSDIGLPDESGLTLLPKLHAISQVPAIALSGFGSDEDIERSREAGFSIHLTKPFSITKLDETILRLLDGKTDSKPVLS